MQACQDVLHAERTDCRQKFVRDLHTSYAVELWYRAEVDLDKLVEMGDESADKILKKFVELKWGNSKSWALSAMATRKASGFIAQPTTPAKRQREGGEEQE